MTPRKSEGRGKIETAHHKALVQFLKTSEGQFPALAFIKHTAKESTGTGPKVTRADRRTGKLVEIPLDVLINSSMGVRAGVWDFEYLGENRSMVDDFRRGTFRGFALELKAPGKTLSPEQKVWGEHYVRNGWRTTIFFHYVPAAIFCVRWVGGNPDNFLFT